MTDGGRSPRELFGCKRAFFLRARKGKITHVGAGGEWGSNAKLSALSISLGQYRR